MSDIPIEIATLFVLTVFSALFVLFLFVRDAAAKAGSDYAPDKVAARTFAVVLLWLCLQGLLGELGFYRVYDSVPPRAVYLLLPMLATVAALLLWRRSRRILDSGSLELLTWLHALRVPVEIVLWYLYKAGVIPQRLTFEGLNYDILAGLSAPLVAWLCFRRKLLPRAAALVWNILGLGLLLNVMINGVLSTPYAFQQFAFDQPNIGLLYFPFVWLPAFIVPLVLLAHLTAIIRLAKPLPPATEAL